MISGPFRLPKVHESGSEARVAVHAPADMRGSATVCHASGDGLRSDGHEVEARASRKPFCTRVPVAPKGIGVQPTGREVVVAEGVGVRLVVVGLGVVAVTVGAGAATPPAGA